ncbi:MAG: hypothetical protein ABIT36_00370 [Steroidobacteraceae bacterium]
MTKEKPTNKEDRPTYTTEFYVQDNDRGVFLGSPMNDNLFTALWNLTAELWVDRRRMWIMTSLLEKHGKVTNEMIEQYVPTAEEEASWKARRGTLVAQMFDPFLRRKDLPHTSSQSIEELPRG